MAGYCYQREIYHPGLNKYRIIKGSTRYEVDNKANAVLAQWNEQWRRQLEREEKCREREERMRSAEESAQYASAQTMEAEKVQEDLSLILQNSLDPKPLNVRKLKQYKKFKEPLPDTPKLMYVPPEPQVTDPKYNPKTSVWVKMSKKKQEKNNQENQKRFAEDHQSWVTYHDFVTKENAKLTAEHETALANWNEAKTQFEEKQQAHNEEVDNFIAASKQGELWAVEKYISLLLENIEYPFDFSGEVEAEYSPESSSVIIDTLLPNVEELPTLKNVTYVKSRNEFKKSYFNDSYMKKKYEEVVYQIVLQILNYVYCAVDFVPIEAITVNGKLQTIDKATGQKIEPYILSVRVSKQEFEAVNLRAVDPKTWFKSAKGVSAANIANITPVAPVVQMSRTDSRFVDGYEVANHIDESVNLASMDWQDFENLIREIFEQEFNVNGGEVKITQASRDGGVDAVAFDPDPIRGGKIVIQAKRYTNVVGVSAVRDLYGTVMNEGANKGILVTTSHYGNDAYSFAQGKPLTLIDGANLLYLLEKHGHKARIDVKEAKKV